MDLQKSRCVGAGLSGLWLLAALAGCASTRESECPQCSRASQALSQYEAPAAARGNRPVWPVVEDPQAPGGAAVSMVGQAQVAPAPPVPAILSSQPASPAPVRVARLERPAEAPAAARSVVHVNERNFAQQVLRSDEPVLVDFYATWCGPCRALAPTLADLAAESPRAKVVKIDVDENQELAERYGVQSLPCLLVFKNGRVVSRQVGVASKSRLKGMLDL